MGNTFDPYYIWLGIPPEDQPPHHYRLLGIELFESNLEVIEAAANRQMAYMQEVSAGEDHIDEAQKILGELSRARVCLLKHEKKAAYDAELRDSFDALAPAPEPPATAKKQSSLAIVVVALLIISFGGLWLLFNRSDTDEEKPVVQQSQESPDVEKENPELEEANRKLEEANKKTEAAEQKLKEQKTRNAAEKAKKQAAEKAKKQAKAEAKKQAAAEAKKQAAAEAKKQAKAEAKKQAKENAKRNAEAAEREAQELRDNPDKLLESKGFEQKGKKWVFAKEEKLKQVTKKLIDKWREWKKRTPQNENDIKAKLEIYNKLLLESFKISAMRQAVSEDLISVLEDRGVTAALVKLNVNTTELKKTTRALRKNDPKLRKAVPKDPIIGPFAALIINEKYSVIIHADKNLMSTHDAPQLFVLPRVACDNIGFRPTQDCLVLKKVNNEYTMNLANVNIPRIRFGFRTIENGTFQTPLKKVEGVPHTDVTAYGGKVGLKAWHDFTNAIKPAIVSHSPAAIAAARKQLDAIQLKKKK